MDDLNFDVDLTTPLDGCLVNDFMQHQPSSVINNQTTTQHLITVNSNNSPASNTNNLHLHNQQQQININRQQVNIF